MIKIMVVDDAAVIREGLKQIISRYPNKFEVCCEANNGQDAIHKVDKYHPDIVITDIKMPKMDGYGLIDYLNQNFPTIKHIILSGYNDFELIRQGLRSGVADYLLKPVDSDELIGLLNQLSNAIIEERKNKLKDIEAEKLFSNSIHIAMEQFYNHLLVQGKLTGQEIEQFMKKYDIHFDMDIFVLLAIHPDRLEHTSYKQPLKDEPNLLDFAIKNLSQELIENRRRQCLVFGTPAHEIITVIGYPSAKGQQEIKEEACQIAEDIRKTIEAYLEHTVTIGVSSICQGLQTAWRAYEQAQSAVKYRMLLGNNRVFHAEDMEQPDAGAIPYPLDYEKRLITLLSLRDQENAVSLVNKIFDEMLEHDNLTPAHVYTVVGDILTRILLFLKECDNELSVSFEETVMRQEPWMSFDSIEQLKRWLNTVISSIIAALNERNSNSKRMIYETKKFVANNYFKNISLNTIADFLNISPQYFSELFKKETGENFIRYLTNVRIEKAKELMRAPDIKTYEIAELVGYDNPTYFNKVFKKMVGVSPQKYRNLHFKKE
mgnify:CR=1 FL=1